MAAPAPALRIDLGCGCVQLGLVQAGGEGKAAEAPLPAALKVRQAFVEAHAACTAQVLYEHTLKQCVHELICEACSHQQRTGNSQTH